MDGWIKLHREISYSKTFQKLTAIQKLIAIYIVLHANHKDGAWFDQYRGVDVPLKRGQLITSRKKIVEEWFQNDKDVTEQKVRTALAKLSKLGFLTITSTNWYSLITVVKYELYQGNDTATNQHFDQDLTTNNNVKNEKNLTTTTMTVSEAHQKVFGTMFMNGLMGDYVAELRKKGYDENFIVELMLETGEAGNKPSLRLMAAIAERWIIQGLNSREESKQHKEAAKVTPIRKKPPRTAEQISFDRDCAINQWISDGGDPNEFVFIPSP